MRWVIADDSSIPRDILRSILMHASEEVVGIAENGAQAVDLVRAMKPDGVILDLAMPVMSGNEAAREIVADTLCRYVIIASSNSQEAVFGPLKALGCICITKPYSAEQMQKVLASLHG